MTDPHEGDALLRAILERPEDDAPRLIYADWLEEGGVEAQAKYIRFCVINPALGSKEWWTFMNENPVVYEWYGAESQKISSTVFTPLWRRGLVGGIICFTNDFMIHVKKWFSQHPITEVEILDKAAIQDDIGSWMIEPHPWPISPSAIRYSWQLPEPVMGNQIIRYSTPKEAEARIFALFVTYGRKIAGLPPL